MFRFQVSFNLENRFRTGSGRRVPVLRGVVEENPVRFGFKRPPLPFVWFSMRSAAREAPRFPALRMRRDGERSPPPLTKRNRWLDGLASALKTQSQIVAMATIKGACLINFLTFIA